MWDSIAAAYALLWRDLCGLPHPFTWYMRESAAAHPLWWILAPVLVVAVVTFAYWIVLKRRRRRQLSFKWEYQPPGLLFQIRKWIREHALVAVLVPAGVFLAWWLLVTHLWGLI